MARLLVATFSLSLLTVPFAFTAGCGAKVSPGDGGGDAGSCGPDDCGPNGLGAPAPCPDGSMPSADYCGRNADGTCSWHGGECPAQKPCHSSSECAATEYCGSTTRSCLGSGVCLTKPTGCGFDYNPVCGCDGKTYGNACSAAMAGVVVASDGACDASTCTSAGSFSCGAGKYCSFPLGTCPTEMPPPVTGTCAPLGSGCGKNLDPQCGCDGVTYSNPCLAAAAGMSILHVGACETPSTTCGAGLPACAPGSYCHYPDGVCGAPDWKGTCTPKGPGGCPSLYDPVCGCDRTTYPNSCVAASAGVSILFKGACDTPPPPTGKSCGGIAGLTCSATEWCDFGSTSCGRDDSMGTCKPRPSACDGVLSPVCGCDGKIYDNVCLAEKAGVGPGTGCK